MLEAGVRGICMVVLVGMDRGVSLFFCEGEQ